MNFFLKSIKSGFLVRIKLSNIKHFFKKLGPGFITGAADDDPSGIATCSQTGAQFGFGQLWTPLFMLPMLIVVQATCAKIGTCKAKGLTYIVAHYYSKKIAFFCVLLLLVANIINIGADIGSMAAATQLIIPVNFTLLIFFYITFITLSQILIGYKKYSTFLKWLCLSTLAYPVTMILINAPFLEIIKSTFIPHIEFNYQFIFLITGIFGTTISPYMFFWQSSQEVEEDHARGLVKKDGRARIKIKDIQRVQIDNVVGMILSQITTWSIIVVSATVLHSHHMTDIKTAADAAKMLEPLVQNFPDAGLASKIIFSIGIIGLGLIAVPVLSGSCAYSLCEILNLPRGFNLKFKSAKAFYCIMFVCLSIGILINYIGIDPMKTLVYSAVINGVLAVPLLFIIILIGKNEKIMGKYTIGIIARTLMWITFVCMFISAISMFFTFGTK